ncbi:MAG TPA: hypothetical protein VGD65_25525 [Chryseosolibacter sp.]
MYTIVILTMAKCSEEEIIVDELAVEEPSTYMASEAAEVGSLSVSGVYTEVQGDVPCATCSYIVDPTEATVDGNELGLKPGSVVCLRKSLKYSSVDFINMEGTENSPIIIGYCAE